MARYKEDFEEYQYKSHLAQTLMQNVEYSDVLRMNGISDGLAFISRQDYDAIHKKQLDKLSDLGVEFLVQRDRVVIKHMGTISHSPDPEHQDLVDKRQQEYQETPNVIKNKKFFLLGTAALAVASTAAATLVNYGSPDANQLALIASLIVSAPATIEFVKALRTPQMDNMEKARVIIDNEMAKIEKELGIAPPAKMVQEHPPGSADILPVIKETIKEKTEDIKEKITSFRDKYLHSHDNKNEIKLR